MSIKSDDALYLFFQELGISTMIHRKVIVSMIQKVLIGDYDIGMGRGMRFVSHRAEDMLAAVELAPSFPLTSQSQSLLQSSGSQLTQSQSQSQMGDLKQIQVNSTLGKKPR